MKAGAKQPWILAGTIVGSGAVFLEGSVVLVAIPSIGRSMGVGMAGMQWVMNGYLLTLSALMLFGGALGDRYSHSRVLWVGLVGFALSSLGCAVAPNLILLIGARLVQGITGALVVPNSLALLETSFEGKERGVAIGRWAAWSGISTAIGPLAGGWLVDAASWRFVFLMILPFAAAAAWIVFRHAPVARKATAAHKSLDVAGAALVTIGLGGLIGALITAPDSGFGNPVVLVAGLGGLALLAAFVFIEARAANPLLPLDVFKAREFVGANLNTLLVYAALSGLFFVLMLELQNGLRYSALAAGASLLPINFLLLVVSPGAGRVAERIGARIPIALGSILTAAGSLLFMRVEQGSSYAGSVLPALVVFGLGLGILVAPLTAAALRSLGERRSGIASGVNNATARLAGLLATAIIPVAVGIGGSRQPAGEALANGFNRTMVICAALCTGGALVAFAMIQGKSASRQKQGQ